MAEVPASPEVSMCSLDTLPKISPSSANIIETGTLPGEPRCWSETELGSNLHTLFLLGQDTYKYGPLISTFVKMGAMKPTSVTLEKF